jgi:hypothetical protein
MFGLGGGLVYVPLLVLGGYPIKVASVVSLFAITLASSSAFTIFFRSGKFDWKLAAIIDPPTDVMAFIGGYYANFFDEYFLNLSLIAVILLAGVLMVKPFKGGRFKSGRFMWRRKFKSETYAVNIPLTCVMTGFIGFFAGMVGVTGGVFKVPIMVLLCGVPMEIAVGTSSGMVFLTALFGLMGHLAAAREVDWLAVASIGIACLIGGMLGAKISLKAGREKLRFFYGILMFTLAVLVTLKAF